MRCRSSGGNALLFRIQCTECMHPRIDKFPPSRVAEAHERMHRGKVRFHMYGR